MQTVTKLEQQKHNHERVNVYLDGEFAFGLNMMDAAALRRGQQLTDTEVIALRERDDVAKAVEKGVELLSYRPRSRAEIRRRLAKKQVTDATIESALERLESLGYVDDRQFARFWIENRLRFKPRGPQALRYELRQKGIAESIISDLLDELVDEHAAAHDAATGRIRRLRGTNRFTFRRKLTAYLQRRGFSYSVSSSVIDALIEELEDDSGYFTEEDETF